jgi:hypothetical protein
MAVDRNSVTQKSWRSLLRHGMLALGLSAALVVTAIGATSAEARVPVTDPRLDPLAAACGALQDRADILREQHRRLALANPEDPRLDAILHEMRAIGLRWAELCKETYGSIVSNPVPGTAVVGNPGVLDAGSQVKPTRPVIILHGGIPPR